MKELTTYHLFGSKKCKNKLKLDVSKLDKIGTFDVSKHLIVGDTDYQKVPDMKKGTYHAYFSGDNLIVSHESVILTKQKLKNMEFKYSGVGIGVDSGTFGFYSLNEIKKLDIKGNNLPIIEGYNFKKKAMIVNLENIDKDFIKKGSMKRINGKKAIGVTMETGVGDGVFDCFIYKDTIAVLIGGNGLGQCGGFINKILKYQIKKLT